MPPYANERQANPASRNSHQGKSMNKGNLIAATAAALFAAGAIVTAASAEGSVKCDGGNACKGQSACKSGTSSCKGQNACKGKGFVMSSSTVECTVLKSK
jgi:uncharacterized membrane protein